MVASALTPLALWLLGQPSAAALFLLLSALLWIMHRANIARLLNGSEGKIGAKAKPAVLTPGCNPANPVVVRRALSDARRCDRPGGGVE